MRKCKECNSCCDLIYMPDWTQYFHCWLCDIYYKQGADGILFKVDNPLIKKEETDGVIPS